MDIGASTERARQVSVDSHDVQEGCVICLRDGFNDATSVEGCGHKFCLDCIKRWAGARRTPVCPLCNNKLAFILRADGSREAVEPGRVNHEEEELNLGCLDHSYFLAETSRLLRRVQSCQDVFYSKAFGPSRAGSEKAEQSFFALGEVIGTLTSQRAILEQGSTFDPNDMIQELYNLDGIVQRVMNGTMNFGVGAEAAPRYGADDADDLPPDDDDILCDDIDDYNQYRARASKPNRPGKATIHRGRRSRKKALV